jgi:hypothetical protein
MLNRLTVTIGVQLAAFLALCVPANPDERTACAAGDGERIRADVDFLAGPALEGREAGTRGGAAAAEYLRAELRKLGARPFSATAENAGTYFDDLDLIELVADRSTLRIQERDGETFEFQAGNDFQVIAGTDGTVRGPVIFAGYGIADEQRKYDDLANTDVRGRIVLLLNHPRSGVIPGTLLFDPKRIEQYFGAKGELTR